MTINCNFAFKEECLFIDHITWNNLIQSRNTFALTTVFETINYINTRGGKVKILMPDGEGISRSLDRASEIKDLINEVNDTRQRAGLGSTL